MSELCEICGRDLTAESHAARDRECLSDGFAREQARADRSEAEFYACKALLIAAQKRAEEAEAGRAAWKDACRKTERERDSNMEAVRSAALREAAEHFEKLAAEARVDKGYAFHEYLRDQERHNRSIAADIRALAALPVEPARRQVTEIANELEAPAAGCPEEER